MSGVSEEPSRTERRHLASPRRRIRSSRALTPLESQVPRTRRPVVSIRGSVIPFQGVDSFLRSQAEGEQRFEMACVFRKTVSDGHSARLARTTFSRCAQRLLRWPPLAGVGSTRCFTPIEIRDSLLAGNFLRLTAGSCGGAFLNESRGEAEESAGQSIAG
jgi:hypothetical protein